MMFLFRFACLGLFPLAKALATPVPLSMVLPSLNHTIEVPRNFSTSTFSHSEVESLGLPMRDANADIQDLQLTWNRLEPIPGIVAVHLYYNLYVTMLNLWRDVKNRPITTTIHTSTPLYPQLVLEVAPQIDRPPTRRLTPSMAALILYSMLYKYLIDEPAFWTVTLRTRDATIDVATFHTKYRLGAIPIASGGPSSTTSSAFAGASDVSDKPGTASDVVSNSRITVHVDFQGHLPGPNPRTTWLMCFRKWSFRLLFDKASTDYVVTYADGVIHRILVKPRDDLRVAVESYEMAPPSGARKLTYDEFFRGIQSIFEAVFMTSQWQLLDAVIYKDGWQAATFRISVIQSPTPGNTNLTVA